MLNAEIRMPNQTPDGNAQWPGCHAFAGESVPQKCRPGRAPATAGRFETASAAFAPARRHPRPKKFVEQTLIVRQVSTVANMTMKRGFFASGSIRTAYRFRFISSVPLDSASGSPPRNTSLVTLVNGRLRSALIWAMPSPLRKETLQDRFCPSLVVQLEGVESTINPSECSSGSQYSVATRGRSRRSRSNTITPRTSSS